MSTINDLERRVEALEKKPARVSRSEERLLEVARQWARMSKLGYYVENGIRIRPTGRDAEQMA